ncbi:MAG: response regulator [Planctomycetota bacterium]
MSLKILLADDHQIVCDGLRMVLENEAGMQVAGNASTGREAVRLTRELEPDVVIMDVAMPELNGIEATRQIVDAQPATRVIGLSMHADKRFIRGMLEARAAGYLLKECAAAELALAIRTVVGGRIYLSPAITGVVVEDYVGRRSDERHRLLTPREREVLQLLAEGNSTRAIAQSLFISVKTVETHRRQIMEKVQIHSVAELTKFAIKEGLTSLDF